MKKKTFPGGIHVHGGKKTAPLPILKLRPVGEAVYPLLQHIGKPAVPVVQKGDTVLVGQRIADAADGLSTCICAGVSGTVKAIEKRLTVSGNRVMSIVIDNDGAYTPIPKMGQELDFHDINNEQIRQIAREAGIVGLGGAGFPTDAKLTPADDEEIEYVIINGAECEPYLTSDYRMMVEQSDALLGGIRVLLKMFRNAKAVIGIEDNKPEAIKLLTHLTDGHPDISVHSLKTKYPQGGERSLIYAITGRKVHSGLLPFQVGCLVINVATVIALYRAIFECTPLITRVITLSGNAFRNPGNYEAPIGCSLAEVVDIAGGLSADPEKMIVGGPMMGTQITTLDLPVQKTTSAVLAFKHDYATRQPETACIHCGRCIRSCPAGLLPQIMVRLVRKGDMAEFERVGGMECVSCGSCSYMCPAHIRLTQRFVQAKAAVIKERRRGKEEKK